MKKIILIILLVCSALSFGQTRRYVNPNAVGGVYDGLSWTTGWRTFSAINWGALSGGGYLYLSGGTDSVVYSQTLDVGASGGWNNYFYIMPGKYSPSPSGHSGRAIFDLGDVNNYGINVDSRSWVYIKGFEIRETGNDAMRFYLTARHCVADSLTIYNVNGSSIVAIGAGCGGAQGYNMDNWDSTDVVYDIEVKNCYILSHEDQWPSVSDLTHWGCVRDIKIHDNIIWNRNVQSAAPPGQHVHMDDIQCYNAQGFTIYNNVLVIDSAVYGHNMIIDVQSRNGAEYSGVDECIVYNNMVYHGGHLASGGNPSTQHYYNRWYGSTSDMAPTYVFHNTFFWANGSGPNFELQRKLIAKNNIMYDYGTLGGNPSVYGGEQTGFWSAYWAEGDPEYQYYIPIDSCTGNLFWKEWTANNEPTFAGEIYTGDGNTGSANWTTWQSTYNGTGIKADPLFTTDFRTGYHDIASNSPAIDAGEQSDWIKAFLEARGLPITDFYGNTRTGVWDIGAMEYVTSGWTPPDTTATVTINSVTGAELGSYHIGSGVLSGADSTFHIWTTTADSFRVTGGSFNTTMVSAVNGNTLYIPAVASNQYSTPVTNYVVVSGTTRSFTVTTKADPGGGGTINGGLLKSSNGRVVFQPTGRTIILRVQ